MTSLRSALVFALLFATSTKVAAFDAEECDVYVFRTQEDALWHCGARLPDSQYCDHKLDDDPPKWAWTWPSDYPDDLCKFMIATVVNDSPPPTPDTFASTLVDWGCYMVEAEIITAAYLVNSTAGELWNHLLNHRKFLGSNHLLSHPQIRQPCPLWNHLLSNRLILPLFLRRCPLKRRPSKGQMHS